MRLLQANAVSAPAVVQASTADGAKVRQGATRTQNAGMGSATARSGLSRMRVFCVPVGPMRRGVVPCPWTPPPGRVGASGGAHAVVQREGKG